MVVTEKSVTGERKSQVNLKAFTSLNIAEDYKRDFHLHDTDLSKYVIEAVSVYG